MSKLSERKFQIWLGIGLVLLAFMLPLIWDLIKEKPFMTTIGAFLTGLGSIFKWVWVTIFEHAFKVWQILVFLILFVFTLGLILYFKSKNPPNIGGHWLSYKSDLFGGIPFKWEWQKGYNGKYDIAYLKPVCKCGTLIPPERNFKKGDYLSCPRCNDFILFTKSEYDIKTVIHDNVERNIYKIE